MEKGRFFFGRKAYALVKRFLIADVRGHFNADDVKASITQQQIHVGRTYSFSSIFISDVAT